LYRTPPSSTVHAQRTLPARSRFSMTVPGGGSRESRTRSRGAAAVAASSRAGAAACASCASVVAGGAATRAPLRAGFDVALGFAFVVLVFFGMVVAPLGLHTRPRGSRRSAGSP
jgi:hypothetical protein